MKDEEEEEALSELMELVKSLSVELEELKAEHECCLFEENAEDFPALEEDVLGSSTEDDVEDLMTVEALHPAPVVPVVSCFDDYSDEEQQSPTSQIDDQRRIQPVYDNYESDSELDMQDIQEHTTEPYPLFLKEDYHEEIIILGLQKTLRSMMKRRDFPRVLFMMIMNLTLGRAKKKNQRSSRRGSLSPVQSL
jgi:hypothetical protein